MIDIPYVALGDKPTEELVRIVEAYLREHDTPVIGARFTTTLCNAAIDWWNTLPTDHESRQT